MAELIPAKKRKGKTGLAKTGSGNLGYIDQGEDFSIADPGVSREYAQELHDKMVSLVGEYESIVLQQAETLYEISESRSYVWILDFDGKPYRDFDTYVRERFGMGDRKANYLKRIWWWYAVENDDPAMLDFVREAGWAKAKELVRVVVPATRVEWLEYATSVTFPELLAARRAAVSMAQEALPPSNSAPPALPEHAGGEAATSPPSDMTSEIEGAEEAEEAEPKARPGPAAHPGVFKRHEDRRVVMRDREGVAIGAPVPTEEAVQEQLEAAGDWTTIQYRVRRSWVPVIKAAIKAAEQLSDGRAQHDGHLLHLICLSFAGGAGVDVEYQRDDLLCELERLLNLTLIAVEEPVGRVVFGEDSVRRLAGVPDVEVIEGEVEEVRDVDQ